MTIKNKYQKYGKISERKFREILRYFALDLNASDTARLTGVSTRSINTIYLKIRQRLYEIGLQEANFMGLIEMDESYFGPHRVRGKRGRGARGKTIVFGLFKRQGKVYTEIVPNASKSSLQKVIRGKVSPASVLFSDGWRGYNGLVDYGYEKHYRVHHGEDRFAQGANHINGIESFWSFAKARLAKFKGVACHTFELHLKECEFRFNYRHVNLYKVLLKLLRKNPI